MTTLLTTKDLQVLINVDKSTIYRMAEDGRLPAIKVGRQWRFPADEIERWLGGTTLAVPPGTQGNGTARRTSNVSTIMVPETCQAIADLVADIFGVMAVVTDMEGRAVTEVSNPCGYFAAIESEPGALAHCIDGWKRLGEEGGIEARFRPSHLGFLCSRAFIRVGTELVGMVIVGGIAPSSWPPDEASLAATAAALGVPAEILEAHVGEVFHLDEGERRRILDTLPKVADLLSQLATARTELVARLDQLAELVGGSHEHQRRTT